MVFIGPKVKRSGTHKLQMLKVATKFMTPQNKPESQVRLLPLLLVIPITRPLIFNFYVVDI